MKTFEVKKDFAVSAFITVEADTETEALAVAQQCELVTELDGDTVPEAVDGWSVGYHPETAVCSVYNKPAD